jgi:AraC-like DNA-binding protein
MMTALVSSLLETPADPGDLRLARLAAIKKFMRKNFRNPALTVDEVVAYSFLSRRALYHLFENEELQVSGHIRALRTMEALELLAEATAWKRSLTDIAGSRACQPCAVPSGNLRVSRLVIRRRTPNSCGFESPS